MTTKELITKYYHISPFDTLFILQLTNNWNNTTDLISELPIYLSTKTNFNNESTLTELLNYNINKFNSNVSEFHSYELQYHQTIKSLNEYQFTLNQLTSDNLDIKSAMDSKYTKPLEYDNLLLKYSKNKSYIDFLQSEINKLAKSVPNYQLQ